MQGDSAAELRLSEVIAALSYALDVTEGQPEGHAVRTCLIGMRIADALGLDQAQRSALFYGLLLKDAGCSSNSAKIATLFGNDDFDVKRQFKLVDQTKPVEGLLSVCRISGSLGAFLRVLRPGAEVTKMMTELRCERGAEIARMLDLPERGGARDLRASTSIGTAAASRRSRGRGDPAARADPLSRADGRGVSCDRGRRGALARARCAVAGGGSIPPSSMHSCASVAIRSSGRRWRRRACRSGSRPIWRWSVTRFASTESPRRSLA